MSIPAFYSGTGRRKTAIARVRLLPGEGEIVVNGRTLEEHFGNAVNESDVRMPFRVTGTEGRFNVMIKVEGGGVTGQAGAIRHGIARALLELDPEANRLPLRQAGLLTRDPRMKERKKYGLKRARRRRSTRSASRRRARWNVHACVAGLRSVAHAPWGALAPVARSAPSPERPSRAQGMTMTLPSWRDDVAAVRCAGATC